jgi:hypothetical protein
MGVYDFSTGELSLITKNNIQFSLLLRPRVTIIRGNSATGKTLLWKTIETIKRTEKEITVAQSVSDIELVNRYTDEDKIEKILSSGGKLIIIDNADMLFRNLPWLAESITDSTDNHFLIFSRDTANLGVTPNHYGELKIADQTVTVDYAFSVKGWL